MDLSPTEEQKLIRETFARFSDDQVRPAAHEIDQSHEFPRGLFEQLGELGFFGMLYPEEDGGSNAGLVAFCWALSEIARGSMSLAAAATMQALMGTRFVQMLGTDRHREKFLRPALAGRKIGGICMTEPDSGSDLHSISTQATPVEGGYRLSGQKMWVSLAPIADFFSVFAKAGPDGKLTIFLVEAGSDGLIVGRSIDKAGVRGMPTSEVAFDDVFVPSENRLGEEGEGETYLRQILARIRIVTAALAVGIGQAALDEAVRYSGERMQFGKPINHFQATQMRLADMATDLEAARHMTDHAAWICDAGLPHHKEAAMAKLFATEAAWRVCEAASRVFASYGYATEYPVERYLRDVRFTLIGGGTSDILKLIIAKELTV